MSRRDSSKLTTNVVFLTLLIQAIAAGGFYLYCSINKWKIRESFTVFLYPIFNILLFVFILLSFIVSLVYFVKKIADTKKFYHSIPVSITRLLCRSSMQRDGIIAEQIVDKRKHR